MEGHGNLFPNIQQLMFWKPVLFCVTYHVPTTKSIHAARAWRWVLRTNDNQLFASVSEYNTSEPAACLSEPRLRDIAEHIDRGLSVGASTTSH